MTKAQLWSEKMSGQLFQIHLKTIISLLLRHNKMQEICVTPITAGHYGKHKKKKVGSFPFKAKSIYRKIPTGTIFFAA